MIEVQAASMSNRLGALPPRTSEVEGMRAFAFRQIEYGFPNPAATAINDQIDREPIDTDWFGKRFHAGKIYTPIEEAGLQYYPTTVRISSMRFKQLTPWVVYASHWGVSEAVKGVIESLEPGKHQFLPVKLKYGTDDQFDEHVYFTLQVNAMVNDVDVEKSDVNWNEPVGGGVPYWNAKHSVPVVLPKNSIDALHLWRNERISKWMMSGDLHDALTQRGLTGGLTFEEHFVI
jgi:hypothetical protein